MDIDFDTLGISRTCLVGVAGKERRKRWGSRQKPGDGGKL